MYQNRGAMIQTEPYAPNLIASLTKLYGPQIEFGGLPKEFQPTHYPEGGGFYDEFDFPVLHNGNQIGTYIVSVKEGGEEVVAKQYVPAGKLPCIDSPYPRLIWTVKGGRRDPWLSIDFP